MVKTKFNKLRSICMWYKLNTPIVVRLYILMHLLNNELENFPPRNTKEITKHINSLKLLIHTHYVRNQKKGKLNLVSVKQLKSIKEYNIHVQKNLLEKILMNTLSTYSKKLKNVKRFTIEDSAVRALTATGNLEHGITVQGFLDEIRKELK